MKTQKYTIDCPLPDKALHKYHGLNVLVYWDARCIWLDCWLPYRDETGREVIRSVPKSCLVMGWF